MNKVSSGKNRIQFVLVKQDRTRTKEEVEKALKAKERVLQLLVELALTDLNRTG